MTRRMIPAACLALAACLAYGQVRICGSCGREDTADGAACTACRAPLPPAAPASSGGDAETPLAAVGPASPAVEGAVADETLAAEAFESVRLEVAEARAAAARQPAVALALFRNARALLAVAGPDQLPPETGRAILDGIRSSRAALAVAEQPCPECDGTGHRRVSMVQLAGGAEEGGTRTQETGANCAACGGGGGTRGQRDVEATRLLILQGRREAGRLLAAEGRTAAGQAWISRKWAAKLTPPQMAAVRRAVAEECTACAGIGLEPCRKCTGTGRQKCTERQCRDGWVEQQAGNTLSPQSALTRRVKCPVCQGAATIACATCRGRASVACAKCGGDGLAKPCRACSGQGTMECRTCRRAAPGAATACDTCKGTRQAPCTRCGGDGVAGS